MAFRPHKGRGASYPSPGSGPQARWQVDQSTLDDPQWWGGRNRDVLRLQSRAVYDVGSAKDLPRSILVMIDVAHVPSGPGLWPAFWTVYKGDGNMPTDPVWPTLGEIDIIEGFDLDT
jgi:hypothetical protein